MTGRYIYIYTYREPTIEKRWKRERVKGKLLQGVKEETEKNREEGCAYRKRRMNYDTWRIGKRKSGNEECLAPFFFFLFFFIPPPPFLLLVYEATKLERESGGLGEACEEKHH